MIRSAIAKLFYKLNIVRHLFICNRISISAEIGRGVKIEKNAEYIGDVKISFGSTVGKGSYINSGIIQNTSIGEYCSIAYGVMIGLREHDHSFITTSPILARLKYGNPELANLARKRTYIHNGVWIGANCVIRQGVTIGEGAVIGAGSVVLKNVPDGEIWAGNPARRIKTRAHFEKASNIS